jgi:flagellar protein FlaG
MESIKGILPADLDSRARETDVFPHPEKAMGLIVPSPVEDPESIQQALDLLREQIGVEDIDLSFSVDRSTGMILVKVLDGKTGEIIRQIPPSELVALTRSMKELRGFLFNGMI